MSFILNSGRFGAAADPGLTLLQGATLWLDASDPGSDSQKAQNKGTGGTALDARLGSTTSVDTNDPLLLTHTGTNYLYLPGTASNSASIPYSSATHPSGAMDVILRVSADDWTPSSYKALLSQGGYTSDQRCLFQLNTSGTLGVSVYTAAGVTASATSSAATGFTDGVTRYVRALVEPGSPDGTCKFYTSTDGSSWTQLGTTQTLTGITDLRTATGSRVTAVGLDPSGTVGWLGAVYGAQIWSGDSTSGGTKQFDANFAANTNQSSFTESSSNAATVTINRSTSGRKSAMVTRPVWLFGTDDYMEIADNPLLDFDAAQDFTLVFVGRTWGTVAGWFMAKQAASYGSSFGYEFRAGNSGSRFVGWVGGNAYQTAGTLQTAGTAFLATAGVNKATDKGFTSLGSTITNQTGTTADFDLSSTTPFRIANTSGSGTYLDGEIVAVAVFRSALTSTELGQIATYYGV